MSDHHASGPFVGLDQASALIDAEVDPRRKAFLRFALTSALTRAPRPRDEAPFDLEQFLMIVSAMLDQAEVMSTVLTGDFQKLEWWPD
ncbi:MAG: hypothetical protein IAE78_03545 [Myxococcus sp.]|nr:hypothetical protein [Myxococcus sp.]